jgi:hypothetical protein
MSDSKAVLALRRAFGRIVSEHGNSVTNEEYEHEMGCLVAAYFQACSRTVAARNEELSHWFIGVKRAVEDYTDARIRRAFRDELRNGREFVVAQMGAALVRAGMGGNVFAFRYWLATHGGAECAP